jgi:hypothetical protein
MILYSVVSTYQLLNAMVQKERVHAGDRATLMIASTLCTKFPNYEQLKALFDDVWVYRLSPVSDKSSGVKNIARYFGGFFHKHHADPAHFEKIYVAGAHYHLSIYLLHKQISFVMMEDAAGVFSYPEVLMQLDARLAPRRSAMARERGLYTGENPALAGRFGNRLAQKDGFDETNFEHQDVIESFAALAPEQQQKIRAFFVPEDLLHVPEDATVVLTQHFANLKMLTFEGQVTIYQYLVDYFLPGRTLVIKPHPDDMLYYGKLFPKARVIREKFPSELLPVLFDHKPSEIATVSSTALSTLKRYFPCNLDMRCTYEQDFPMTHRYDAALRFLQAAGADCVCCLGANREIVDQLWPQIAGESAKASHAQESDITGRYLLVNRTDDGGEAALRAVRGGGCAVFIDQAGTCAHFLTEVAEDAAITPLVIRKTALRKDDMYTSLEDETIWVAGDEATARAFRYERILESSGVKVGVFPLNDQEREIQVLKGRLKATETSLLAMIRANKELEKQLSEAKKKSAWWQWGRKG